MDAVVQLSDALRGRYEVERGIGAGGMATVYLARDVKHNRKVALKVLNPELGAVLGVDRFLAEIQVTANLQHPNLLPLFDSGEARGLLFYVMPYVEGESLRARLDREKQLPVSEAVRIAVAVASGLEYAHAHGVIHRDLKPENILVQADQPVIADFGIALAVSKAGGSRVTQTGISLGTPQYMSPEQATGDRAIDGRTDIYSLAALTYEMLTGEPPHTGATAQAIVAKLMTEDVRPTTVLRRNVPVHVDAAVRRALEKLPADRFASAAAFGDALQGKIDVATGARFGVPRTHRSWLARFASSPLWFGAFVATVVVGGLVLPNLSAPDAGEALRLSFSVSPSQDISVIFGRTVALTPDGRTVLYATDDSAGRPRIFARTLTSLDAYPIRGSEGGTLPFVSTDGLWLGFVDGRQLKKVPLAGGAPTTLTELGSEARGAAWLDDGRIVVSDGGAVLVIPGEGEKPKPLGVDSTSCYWPVAVPGRAAVICASMLGADAPLRVFPEGARSIVLDSSLGAHPLGFVDDELIYGRLAGTLSAMRFSTRRLRAVGRPRDVGDGVQVNFAVGEVKAAVSASGSLAYVTGSDQQLVLVDARGVAQRTPVPSGKLNNTRVSPDGQRVALDVIGKGRTDVWIFELSSGAPTRLTSGGILNSRAEWSHDGRRILFRSTRSGRGEIWIQPADGSAFASRLLGFPNRDIWEGLLSPDGNFLLYRTGSTGKGQIWYRRLDGDSTERVVGSGQPTEWSAQLSPNGRWVAYASDQAGRFQVYVRPFPGPGPVTPVSVDGGNNPMWSRDGKRIYFVRGRQVYAATVSTTPTFRVQARSLLFEGTFLWSQGHAAYDVTPDGKYLAILQPVLGKEEQVVVVHNWKVELRRAAAGPAVTPSP